MQRKPQPSSGTRRSVGPRSTSSLGRLRVLVLEAHVDFALLLEEMLTGDGHRPALVFTGEQASVELADHDFDVALVESYPPGYVDVVAFLLAMRRAGRPEAVVVMTDFRSPAQEAAVLAAGAAACIAKPFCADELFGTLRRALVRTARAGTR